MDYSPIYLTNYVTFSDQLYKYRCIIKSTYLYSLFMCVYLYVELTLKQGMDSKLSVVKIFLEQALKSPITSSICGFIYIYTIWYGKV